MRERDEQQFSNPADFPTRLAYFMFFLTPAVLFLCVILPALFESNWVKFVRDLAMACYNVWLVGYTLVSRRPALKNIPAVYLKDELHTPVKEARPELLDQIIEVVISEQLYKNFSLSLDDLTKAVGSNRKYVSQAINASHYGSFYKLINGLRVAYAMELKAIHPEIKKEELATASGFNSRYVLSRWSKQCMDGQLPSFDDSVIKHIRNELLN